MYSFSGKAMYMYYIMSCNCCMFCYRGLEFVTATRSLRIRTVQPFHAGLYRCHGVGIEERCVYFSDNATVTVRGMYMYVGSVLIV